MSADQIAAVGAFLSGAGSVLTGFFAIRWERKRGKEECEERWRAYREGLKEGREER